MTALTSGIIGSFIPRPTPHQATDTNRRADELPITDTDGLPIAVDGT